MLTLNQFYQGQRKVILDQLEASGHWAFRTPFKVFTVDSYQGEENDIILLSLVRSNESFSVGFLDSKNRLVVALSRARRGLYLFGNTVTLASSESTEEIQGREALWDPLIQYLKRKKSYAIDGGFPITCAQHGNVVRITDPIHWIGRAGGCDQKCGFVLDCGHLCPYPCHPFDHQSSDCKEPCPAILGCGHGCSNECGQDCHCTACAIAESQLVNSYSWDAMNAQTREVLYDDYDEASGYHTKRHNQMKKSQPIGKNRHVFFSEVAQEQNFHHKKTSVPSDSHVRSEERCNFFEPSMPKGTRNKDHLTRIGEPSLENQKTRKEFSPFKFLSPISRGKAPAIRSPPKPAKSNPSSWQAWNAQKSDQQMAKQRELENAESLTIDRSKLVFSERYVPVTVENNKRRTNSKATVESIVARNEEGKIKAVHPQQQAMDVIFPKEEKSSSIDLIDFKEDSSHLASRDSYGLWLKSEIPIEAESASVRDKLEDGLWKQTTQQSFSVLNHSLKTIYSRQGTQSSLVSRVKMENSVSADAPLIQLKTEAGLWKPDGAEQTLTMAIPGMANMWQMPVKNNTCIARSLWGSFDSPEDAANSSKQPPTSDDDSEQYSFSADKDHEALLSKSNIYLDKEKGVPPSKLKKKSPLKPSDLSLRGRAHFGHSVPVTLTSACTSLSESLLASRDGMNPMEEMINLKEFLLDGPIEVVGPKVVQPKQENLPKFLLD